jgi:hypothetical protein
LLALAVTACESSKGLVADAGSDGQTAAPNDAGEDTTVATGGDTADQRGPEAPACTDPSSVDASSSADRTVVATIVVSLSTNSSEIDVAVYSDGSAERTLGPSRPAGTTSLDPQPKSYPAGSPEVLMFLCDLAAAGDVSAIPIRGDCGKSVSFGTTTTVTAGGKTSGDLQCLQNASAAATALAGDCVVLSGMRT